MRPHGAARRRGKAVTAAATAAAAAVVVAAAMVAAGGLAAPAPVAAAAAAPLAAGTVDAPPPFPTASPSTSPPPPLPPPSPHSPPFPLPPNRPRWCDALLAAPAAAGAGGGCRPTTDANCGAGAAPRFYGQWGQDAWAWTHHFAALRRPGVFLDVATNDAIALSNTYAFEACLGWTGVCVEPLVRYHAGIYARRRRCELVPFCLAEEAKGVTFIDALDLSGIAATNKNANGEAAWRVAVAPRRHLDCTTAADVLSHSRLSQVDWMSLDVEGGELDVLRGIDWAVVNIDVITLEVETAGQEALAFLVARGYKPIYYNPDRPEEVMCIHPNVTLGQPTP